MSHFVGVGLFWIDHDRTDLGCWRLTLIPTALSMIKDNGTAQIKCFKTIADKNFYWNEIMILDKKGDAFETWNEA